MMLSKTRLSYVLKDVLIKKGVRNLLEFTDAVANEGLRLTKEGSLSAMNLQNSLKNKDRGFFNSNSVSRTAFYKIVINVIKKESHKKQKNSIEAERVTSAFNFHNPQYHFGSGDNIGRNKTANSEDKSESFVEKFFWRVLVTLIVGVAIVAIVYWLGFTRQI